MSVVAIVHPFNKTEDIADDLESLGFKIIRTLHGLHAIEIEGDEETAKSIRRFPHAIFSVLLVQR